MTLLKKGSSVQNEMNSHKSEPLLHLYPLTEKAEDCYTFLTNGGHYTDGDAGFDLRVPYDVEIPPRTMSYVLPLGVQGVFTRNKTMEFTTETINCCGERTVHNNCVPRNIHLPYNVYLRSSTGKNTKLRLANHVAVIDKTYRGELMAIIDNWDDEPHKIEAGTRLFQICLPSLKSFHVRLAKEDLSNLYPSERGSKGLGSTGNK